MHAHVPRNVLVLPTPNGARIKACTHPQARFVTPEALDDAYEVLHGEPPNLVVIDAAHTSPEAINFVLEARSMYPALTWLVLTEEPPRASWGLSFVSQHDALGIERALRSALTQDPHGSANCNLDAFHLLSATRAVGALVITSGDRMGLVWFEQGEIVGAETSQCTGTMAMAAILSWPTQHCFFEADTPVPDAARTSLSHLLLRKEIPMNDLKQTWHALRIIKGWHGAGVSSAGSMASLTVDAPSGRLQTITETLQRYNLFMVAEQDGAPEDQIPQERMTMYANSYVLTRQDGERLWFLIIDKAQGNLAMARMQFEKAIETHAS